MRHYLYAYRPTSIGNRNIFSLNLESGPYHSYDEVREDATKIGALSRNAYGYDIGDWKYNDLENQSINSFAFYFKSDLTGKLIVQNYNIVIREDHPAFNFEVFVNDYFTKLKQLSTDQKLGIGKELKDNILERILIDADVA